LRVVYIYIISTPNLGLLITVFVLGREHGRFNQEHEGAAREHEGAGREHAGSTREHAGKSQFGSPYSVGHSIRDPELAALGSA